MLEHYFDNPGLQKPSCSVHFVLDPGIDFAWVAREKKKRYYRVSMMKVRCVCLDLEWSHIGTAGPFYGLLLRLEVLAEEQPGHPARWNSHIMQTASVIGVCAGTCAIWHLIPIPLGADGTRTLYVGIPYTHLHRCPVTYLRLSTLWLHPSSSFRAAVDQESQGI